MQTTKFMVASLFAGLLLAANGCAADTSPPGSEGDEADIKTAKQCGGIANIQCAAGTTCKLSGNFPDASGTCVKAAGVGQAGGTCAGIANIQCAASLTCKLMGNYPDASGVCVKSAAGPAPGKSGGFCGGIAGIACDKPLTCHLSGNYPDASGTCGPAASGPKCGTNTCASGDVCCDALHGICTKPGQFCTN